MIVLSVSFRIQAEGRDEVLSAFGVLQKAILASNEGLSVYHFSVDLEDENLIHVYEEWDSVESLKAHGQKEYMAPFRAMRSEKGVEVVRSSRWRAEDLGQF